MKNIVILAGGPPKAGRNRHLEINQLNSRIIIDDVIEKCTIENTNLYIVIDETNYELMEYVKVRDNITILTPKDKKIYSTLEIALSMKGDCVLVLGDLIGLLEGDIKRFVDSEYKSATSQYKQPWGNHIPSHTGDVVRRGDCGDCIQMIAEEHKDEFLSEDTLNKAKESFYKFNSHQMNEEWANDYGTFMSYTFFNEIWSNPHWTPTDNSKGTILFEHQVYADND
jgi:hypothetical protein|tara:strand:- start:39 stop:713 length:675 start_codon:yes stop_codon:yes gene_type:complete